MTVQYTQEGLYIQSVTEGGPTQAAGLLPGELIVAADGTDLTG